MKKVQAKAATKSKKEFVVGSFDDIIAASVSGNPAPKPKPKKKTEKKNN